jgi:hypothetical protein
MDTSGVCVLVKRPELVDGFARQFRGDAGEYRARKEYLAIGVGDVPTGSTVAYEQTGVDTNEAATTHDDVASTPEFTEFTVDAHIGPHASIPEARAIHPPPPEPVQKRPASHPGADPDAPKPARTDVRIVSSASMTITTDGGEDDEGEEGETTVVKTAVLARVTLHTGRRIRFVCTCRTPTCRCCRTRCTDRTSVGIARCRARTRRRAT